MHNNRLLCLLPNAIQTKCRIDSSVASPFTFLESEERKTQQKLKEKSQISRSEIV